MWRVAAAAVVKAQGLNGQAVAPGGVTCHSGGKVAVAADTAQPRVRELCLHKKLLQTIILPQTPLRLMRIWNRIPDTMHLEPGARCASAEPLMLAAARHLGSNLSQGPPWDMSPSQHGTLENRSNPASPNAGVRVVCRRRGSVQFLPGATRTK